MRVIHKRLTVGLNGEMSGGRHLPPLPGEAENQRAPSLLLNCFYQQHTLTNCHCGCIFIADCPPLSLLSPCFSPSPPPAYHKDLMVRAWKRLRTHPPLYGPCCLARDSRLFQAAPRRFAMRVLLGKEALRVYYFLHTLSLLWKY